jgi:predicted dehydrogenase
MSDKPKATVRELLRAGEEWQQTSDRVVRMAVVGGGFGTGFHWHEHPNCKVVAVADPISDRRSGLMERYQCETAYETLEEVLADDGVEGVAIFSGAPDHARHVCAIMEAGKHPFCAVPACMDLEEAEMMAEVKERTGGKYMMAETSYYRWETQLARLMHREELFGELVYCEGEYYHPLEPTEREGLWLRDGQKTWRFGFPPMLYPTHSTAFLVGVTGERIEKVSCLGWSPEEPWCLDNRYGNPYSHEVSMCLTDQGHSFRCNVSWTVAAYGERAQWFGRDRSLYAADEAGRPFVIETPDEGRITDFPDYWHLVPPAMRYDSGHGSSHPFLTNEFVSALLEEREPAVNLYEALAMTVPGIVAHQSALWGGEQLEVPQFG